MSEAPHSRLKRWLTLTRYCAYTAFIVAGSYGLVFIANSIHHWVEAQYAYAYESIKERLTEVRVIEKTTVLDPDTVPVEELVVQISDEMGINPAITRAICTEESGKDWNRTDRYRYEAKLMPLTKLVKGTEDEKRLWSGSWGLMQVIPIIWAKRCPGVKSYSSLTDPATNLRCGLTVLKLNLDTYKDIKQPGRRLREALRAYNGSGPDAEAYADRVMQRIADELLTTIGNDI